MSGGSTQLVTMLVTFLLIMVPIAILNASIAKRKGKSGAEFGWLSVIPFVGYFLTIYLVSLTDKSLSDRVDRILEIMEGRQPGAAATGTVPRSGPADAS
jgi:hypothetical protein